MKKTIITICLLFLLFIFLKIGPSPIFASPLIPQNLIPQLTQQGTAVTTSTPDYNIEFGKVETVTGWPLCGDSSGESNFDNWDIPDGNARALVDANGNVQLYSAWEVLRKSIGPNLTDVQHNCNIIYSSHHDPVPRQYDNNSWPGSPYILDNNLIYSLMHTEFHGSGDPNDPNNPYRCPPGKDPNWDCWWNSVNLAKSTDNGNTFTNAATPPNHNVSNTSIDFNPMNVSGMTGIFGPSNIISKDGYYYAEVLVHLQPTGVWDPMKSCLMRTNNLADPASWHFWNGTDFSMPARGIPAYAKCTSGTVGYPYTSAYWILGDLHHSNYLNQYINVNGGFRTLAIHTGATLTADWALKNFEVPAYVMDYGSNYFTFIQPGAETRNFEDIGRSPWLYFSTCGGSDCSWTNGTGGHNIVLKRVRVRFYTPGDQYKYDVLDLHFNEYKGSKTLDSSFYGNDGTLNGDAALQGANKYIHFGGSGNVTVNNDPSLSISNQITISARIRTTQNPPANTYPVIVQKQSSTKRNYGLYLMLGGKLNFSIWNGAQFYGSVSNGAINDGAWHSIQVTFSDTTGAAQFVIDGKLDNTVTQGGKLADGINDGALAIGNGFTGDLDSLTVYNYLLPVPSSASKPGDLNNDGKVDIFDYNLLVGNFGKTGSNIIGDIDINGKVDVFDYNSLLENFGK